MEPGIFIAVRPVYRLGILPGDRIVFDSNGPHLFTRYRPVAIPNPGAVLLAVEEGDLEQVNLPTAGPSFEEIRRVVGESSPPRSFRRGAWRRRHLTLLP